MTSVVRARSGVLGVGLAAATMLVPACDDGGRGETCGKVAPCGGEVVGEWQVGAACASSAPAIGALLTAAVAQVCPAATVGPLDVRPAGSLSFRADLTFSASVSADVSTRLGFPASCLGGAPCALAGLGLQAWLVKNALPAGIESLDCAGTVDCDCTLVTHVPAIAEAGTYARAGASLTLDGGRGPSVTADYCVQEPELHIIARPGASGQGASSLSLAADIVATRLW